LLRTVTSCDSSFCSDGEHNISQSTFYNWRSKYGGMDATLISRLKELEVENARLKKMYADECLKSDILQDAMSKKW